MQLDFVFSKRAEKQYISLFNYLKKEASLTIAKNYTDEIFKQCENLTRFPYKGTLRDDLGQGYRSFGYKKRVTIVFKVNEADVTFIGIFYGGQNITKKYLP